MLVADLGLDDLQNVNAPGSAPTATALPASVVVARRAGHLEADGQTASPLELEAVFGRNDLVEVNFIERCRLVRDCVGRIRISAGNKTGWATGFLVAPGLLLTNHHVFEMAESAKASTVEFGCWLDVAGAPPIDSDIYTFDPGAFFIADAALDYALVAISAKGRLGASIHDKGYLRLIPETGKVKEESFVTIFQHPDGDPMRIALRENEVTRADDGESYIWYRADTAHGSSGAPAFNDSLQIVALHAKGIIKRDGQGRYARHGGGWAESLAGLKESDVIWDANLGYRISRISKSVLDLAHAHWPGMVGPIEKAMEGGDVLANAVLTAKGKPAAKTDRTSVIETESKTMPSKPPAALQVTSDRGGLLIPLQLRVTLEAAGAPAAANVSVVDTGSSGSAELEAEAYRMQVPIIYDGLEERDGFDAGFLELAKGKPAPTPQVTKQGKKILAPLLDGSGYELKYHRFSVWMHRDRRLALYTASNVDWRNRKKIVEGKSTSRAALAGFPEKSRIAEQWVDDPRIDTMHQLPDIFYTDDRSAFDKGHLVRRDDVCWGDTYQDIQMSNGDTYHVTNCSPQIKPFNQGPHGEENWGDLEAHVAKATKTDAEKAILYAGPIFGRDDRWFHGKDEQGPARIQIPSRFWKVVVVKGDSGAQAYGFILEQDVREITEDEFYVTDEWIGALKPIKEIASELRGWLDLDDLVACDAYKSV